MTPNQIRDAVRTLRTQGQSLREISRGLKLSRNTVRRILRTASLACLLARSGFAEPCPGGISFFTTP